MKLSVGAGTIPDPQIYPAPPLTISQTCISPSNNTTMRWVKGESLLQPTIPVSTRYFASGQKSQLLTLEKALTSVLAF